ncbi:class D beta-lactamase [Sulfurimonas sp. HSL1-2]|uniref:class D beta-lactamase n=1 Tax=Thiomicrolovo zhangzhouensis TaxID=3131933 RepID=UPI0031F9DE06
MHPVRRKRFRLIIVALLLFPTVGFGWEENAKIAELFHNANVDGTFILYDMTGNAFIGYNQTRTETRYIPASTFKIANALIGLSSGVVKSVDEPLPYKGPAKPFIPEWGHDMGLCRAIAISNVPIYQELARRIGLERMRAGLVKLHYGNEETGKVVDRFWLDGPLKISALEQVEFLTGLVQNRLPLPKQVQESVREILLLEEGADWKLYGKTGWQNAPNNGVGWLVGWLEKKGHFYVFALNIDIKKPSDAKERVKLAKASLKLLGLI